MNDFQDVPLTKRKKERKIAEKLASELLFGQKIKFRFVKNLERTRGMTEYGRTEYDREDEEYWKGSVKHILIFEDNFWKSKYNPRPRKTFIKTTTHELAHASEEVRFNPEYDDDSEEFQEWCDICGEPHLGKGHDRVWHDKYLEFRKKASQKKFVKYYLEDKK